MRQSNFNSHTQSLVVGKRVQCRQAILPRGNNIPTASKSFPALQLRASEESEGRLCFKVRASSVSQGTRDKAPLARDNDKDIGNGVKEGYWVWNDHRIRYHYSGKKGPPVILIHGFGGFHQVLIKPVACSDHWRKNISELGQTCRAYAIDLLGYGYSDKPDPRNDEPNAIYNFEVWGKQIADFGKEFLNEPYVLCCNSVGGLAGLVASREDQKLIKAVQSRLQKFYVARLQKFLRTSKVGVSFFGAVAKPKAVRNVLRECYGDKNAVDDELVDYILKPGLEPGAAQVFLDFISYSGGPLPEDLIENAPCPVSILWGDKDPWEKIEWGRAFKEYKSVEEFVELPGVGHCPMDENPSLVNPLMLKFIQRHLPDTPS